MLVSGTVPDDGIPKKRSMLGCFLNPRLQLLNSAKLVPENSSRKSKHREVVGTQVPDPPHHGPSASDGNLRRSDTP
jgi:hypothetical protein